MQQGYFITGTDTNAGKTWATLALMQAFKNQHRTVVGMKPVASGCRVEGGKLKNDDALLLQQYASIHIDYDLINPYAYEPPISPHLAGKNNPVDLAALTSRFEQLKNLADIVLVEGAGGWYAPINDREDISDLALAFGLPVILTVAIKLGCINHAKLTAQAIAIKGLKFAGWIAVRTDADMPYAEANISTLEQALHIPLLGVLPYLKQPDFSALADFLALNKALIG
ncbi:dethiobiotin synthase [Methylomicrobium sp. Wu6]|uniref:dethiobiotin synthase n=1 Tax=Methylomicrobium sp. Wu6 TaxID=3107928 RepID=UPI002DD69358|nr:dethiobiotin synthase [Methylomicrobium sp. Wu6]MEC4750576.1 dethiobiotin synthase [Methylomicrobium sp. Wu6]